MTYHQEELIILMVNNSKPAWEIEAVYKRCIIYFGPENAFRECQNLIDFADQANIELLESFRLQVEVTELAN